MKKVKALLFLHLILVIYSLSSVFSKFASKEQFFSLKWILLYGLLIFCLGIYAILWQQILKYLPLNIAYANKSVTLAWGMIFGALIFNEENVFTLTKIIGALIVLIGVIIMVTAPTNINKAEKLTVGSQKESQQNE